MSCDPGISAAVRCDSQNEPWPTKEHADMLRLATVLENERRLGMFAVMEFDNGRIQMLAPVCLSTKWFRPIVDAGWVCPDRLVQGVRLMVRQPNKPFAIATILTCGSSRKITQRIYDSIIAEKRAGGAHQNHYRWTEGSDELILKRST